MKNIICLLLAITSLTVLSCSKSSEPAPAPEPNVTNAIAGTYSLTKLTNKDAASTVAVTGTGSVTITAISNTTVDMRTLTTIKQGTSSTSRSDITLEYKVAQNGSTYTLSSGSKEYGTVSGNKLILDITVFGGLLTPNNTYLTGEFIK